MPEGQNFFSTDTMEASSKTKLISHMNTMEKY